MSSFRTPTPGLADSPVGTFPLSGVLSRFCTTLFHSTCPLPAIAGGGGFAGRRKRRGLPEQREPSKARLLSASPSVRLRRPAPLNIERPVSSTGKTRPGLSMLTRKRESTRERESSTPKRVGLSRVATPFRGTVLDRPKRRTKSRRITPLGGPTARSYRREVSFAGVTATPPITV